MKLTRHLLVEITEEARNVSFERLKKSEVYTNQKLEQIKQLIVLGYYGAKIPGIVRRRCDSSSPDLLAIGFSSPLLFESNRLRIPELVEMKDVNKVVTPYEVLTRSFVPRTKALNALEEIKELAQINHVELGVWGSAGLEIYTGLQYTHDYSDLDLIVKNIELNELKSFYAQLEQIRLKYNIKIDVELTLGDFEIRIAELFLNTSTVLGKGLESVALYPKDEILKTIKNSSLIL